MKRTFWVAGGAVLLALLYVGTGRAQMSQSPAPAPAPATAPAQGTTGQAPSGQLPSGQLPSGQGAGAGQGGAAAPVKPPVDPAEEAAYKAILAVHGTNAAQQIQLGEAFAAKYPTSRYLAGVYSTLALDYLTTGAGDKVIPAAQKAIDLDPDNVDALSVLVWATARTLSPAAPGAADEFAKLENYAHHAITLLTAMVAPAGTDPAQFAIAKNDNLSMCHSGLGVIEFKQHQYDEAVAELTQAVQLADTPDAVDYFMLGHADEATGHFADAEAAYTKCTDQGPMTDRCKAGLADAKQRELLAPAAPKP
jgi:tetratricopeptide (TPR) repeat protein